jgi:hypothetical protein
MVKPQKKEQKKQKNAKKSIDISFSLKLTPLYQKIILAVLLILSIVLPYYYITYAFSVNHYNSFPLDDPWIHLQFAKNLAEYGSFSYFKNELVTAGSTSPLYTFILAAGFFITKNEMWLSYILGIVFFSVSVFYLYKISNDTFPKENWLAIGACIIFVLDKWINFISVTGMETTMHIFLMLACFYYYHRRNAILFAVTLGLTLWSRPDAVAFIFAIIVDYLLLLYLKNKSSEKNQEVKLFTRIELLKIGFITGGLMALYFAMNIMISGTLLPNTYGAKLAYYSPQFRNRTSFLEIEVWHYFTESAYVFLIVPFAIALIKIYSDVFKLKYNRNFIATIFIFTLIFIYWYKLPYAHRFGRYLMPIFPFYILLFLYGIREFFTWLSGFLNDKKLVNALNVLFITVVIIFYAIAYTKNKEIYQQESQHIYLRQVAAAKWLKNNTPENSVVGTHDVGAIAFYSDRKIIDIVGLINPQFIPKLNTPEFVPFVTEELNKQGVTHVAFLKEWFQVVNQPMLFSGGDQGIEIMEIYEYLPRKTHILSSKVNSGIMYVGQLLAKNQFKQALEVLNQLLMADPTSSLTYYIIAYTYSQLGDGVNSEKNLKKAIEIFPGYREAVSALGNIYITQNKISEARTVYNNYLSINPSDPIITKMLTSLGDTLKTNK